MMDAPTSQGGGEIYTDALWENFDWLEPALTIDEERADGQGNPQDVGHGFGGITQPGADIGKLAFMRGQDRGAATKKTTSSTTYKFFNDLYFGIFGRGFEPPPISHNPGNPVFTRGINSFAHNNGPQGRPTAWTVGDEAGNEGGWKRGFYEQSNVQRDAFQPNRQIPIDYPAARGETIKYVEADIVTIIGDAPPPHQSDVYASPFSSLQRFLPTRRRVRGIRREPGPWDEALQATDPATSYPSGNDGMVVN